MDIKKEQLIILDMVAEGKLSTNEALGLLSALDESAAGYETASDNLDENPASEPPVGLHFKDEAFVFCFPNIELHSNLDWACGKIHAGLESLKADINQTLNGVQFQLN
ncbi:MAG: hypothetical protein MUO76_02695 [Anaerolineaceae bacterium]|nr:hypothetical protein [Anaerolineaceae bacterium]